MKWNKKKQKSKSLVTNEDNNKELTIQNILTKEPLLNLIFKKQTNEPKRTGFLYDYYIYIYMYNCLIRI